MFCRPKLPGPNTSLDFRSPSDPGFKEQQPSTCYRDSLDRESRLRRAAKVRNLFTKTELPELDGKTASFLCVKNPNPRVHGVLRVDKEHPHHFVFEDGISFFLQGYLMSLVRTFSLPNPQP